MTMIASLLAEKYRVQVTLTLSTFSLSPKSRIFHSFLITFFQVGRAIHVLTPRHWRVHLLTFETRAKCGLHTATTSFWNNNQECLQNTNVQFEGRNQTTTLSILATMAKPSSSLFGRGRFPTGILHLQGKIFLFFQLPRELRDQVSAT